MISKVVVYFLKTFWSVISFQFFINFHRSYAKHKMSKKRVDYSKDFSGDFLHPTSVSFLKELSFSMSCLKEMVLQNVSSKNTRITFSTMKIRNLPRPYGTHFQISIWPSSLASLKKTTLRMIVSKQEWHLCQCSWERSQYSIRVEKFFLDRLFTKYSEVSIRI